jgi:hypothetical protein
MITAKVRAGGQRGGGRECGGQKLGGWNWEGGRRMEGRNWEVEGREGGRRFLGEESEYHAHCFIINKNPNHDNCKGYGAERKVEKGQRERGKRFDAAKNPNNGVRGIEYEMGL